MLNANEKRAHSVHGIQYTYTFFHSAPAVPITIHTNAGASTFFLLLSVFYRLTIQLFRTCLLYFLVYIDRGTEKTPILVDSLRPKSTILISFSVKKEEDGITLHNSQLVTH